MNTTHNDRINLCILINLMNLPPLPPPAAELVDAPHFSLFTKRLSFSGIIVVVIIIMGRNKSEGDGNGFIRNWQ